MRAEDRWPDGTLDVIHVESLQPCEWIESQKIHVGSVVTPPLDLVELVLPAELKAEIVEILPCPAIQDGPGRVVVTTVNHLHPQVVELSLEDARGTPETLRATETHKFYSHTRNAWLSARDLQSGEKLEGITGLVTVTSVNPLPGTHRVYNLTVQGEHFYRVAESGVLVHNFGCTPVYHGTDSKSAADIVNTGLDPNKWRRAAGGAGTDPKGFSVTTDLETAQGWAKIRAAERGGQPVVIEAKMGDLPLKRGSPGEWTDPNELFIDLGDFGKVGGGIFRWLMELI